MFVCFFSKRSAHSEWYAHIFRPGIFMKMLAKVSIGLSRCEKHNQLNKCCSIPHIPTFINQWCSFEVGEICVQKKISSTSSWYQMKISNKTLSKAPGICNYSVMHFLIIRITSQVFKIRKALVNSRIKKVLSRSFEHRKHLLFWNIEHFWKYPNHLMTFIKLSLEPLWFLYTQICTFCFCSHRRCFPKWELHCTYKKVYKRYTS
jgi:hypothetical protein